MTEPDMPTVSSTEADATSVSPPPTGGPTLADLRWWLQLVALLQVVLLIAVVVVYLQLDGLPQRTAALVPPAEGAISGEMYQVQQQLGTLGDQLAHLQGQLDAIESALPTARP